MKTRPLKFNAEMVRAILDGRKTQTRRLLKPQPPDDGILGPRVSVRGKFDKQGVFGLNCPFGQPGDRLWVQEEFLLKKGVVYRADGESDWGCEWKRPGLMKRWASRITLEITNIKVERLHHLSCADCIAEGVTPIMVNEKTFSDRNYMELWDSFYGTGSWIKNPLVWVIEFKKIKPEKPT